jgi:hypothetical protein
LQGKYVIIEIYIEKEILYITLLFWGTHAIQFQQRTLLPGN